MTPQTWKEVRFWHYIQFHCDNQHHITRTETDTGQWRKYKYNNNRMITDVVGPEGLLRHYLYDSQLMTQVQDGHCKVLLQNSYQNGYLIAQEFAGGKVFRYTYRFNMDPEIVVITMPN